METSATPGFVVLAQDDEVERDRPPLAERVLAQLRPVAALKTEPGQGVSGAVVVARSDTKWLTRAIAGLLDRGIASVVVVGREKDVHLADRVLELGAHAYYVLPQDDEALALWARDVTNRWRVQQGSAEPKGIEMTRYTFSSLIGESPEFRAAVNAAAKVGAQSNSAVFLAGESGTGKESLAKAIHFNGPRQNQPFVVLNCGALPPALLESELFGYETGAFEGAIGDKPGLWEIAEGGTLFLDDAIELTEDLQLKLLRALEEGQARRLGGRKRFRIDVRIIAAAEISPLAAVEMGKVRPGLHYWLSVAPIQLPPLRERGRDVVLLAEHFLEMLSRELKLDRPAIEPAVEQALLTYPWPGNVTELRNAVERALLLGEGTLRAADLFSNRLVHSPSIPFPATMDAIERAAAQAMVARFNGNKKAAAAALRISRTRLYRLLKEAHYEDE